MKRLPPEVDRLMWTLAEEGSDRAFSEFEARYPEHRAELGRRIAMLRGLKGQRASTRSRSTVPAFVPREPRPAVRRWAVPVALGLAGLAAASFFGTRALLAAPEPVRPRLDRPSTPAVVRQDPPKPPTVVPEIKEVPTPPEVLEPYHRPVSLDIKRAKLIDAIHVVAATGKLEVEIAPGLANPDVELRYDQMSVIDILRDLGRQYAFTAFDQGDGKILIIPAVDDPPGPEEDVSGSVKGIDPRSLGRP